LFPVPHRQYVFSIPKIIRRYFLYDHKLLGKLSQCATSSLKTFFQIVLNKKYGVPGIALAVQTFGDYARWHPHLHALVADGLFTESVYFYVMPNVDLRPLGELFRTSVLKMLQKEGRIDDSLFGSIWTFRPVHGKIIPVTIAEKNYIFFRLSRIISVAMPAAAAQTLGHFSSPPSLYQASRSSSL